MRHTAVDAGLAAPLRPPAWRQLAQPGHDLCGWLSAFCSQWTNFKRAGTAHQAAGRRLLLMQTCAEPLGTVSAPLACCLRRHGRLLAHGDCADRGLAQQPEQLLCPQRVHPDDGGLTPCGECAALPWHRAAVLGAGRGVHPTRAPGQEPAAPCCKAWLAAWTVAGHVRCTKRRARQGAVAGHGSGPRTSLPTHTLAHAACYCHAMAALFTAADQRA